MNSDVSEEVKLWFSSEEETVDDIVDKVDMVGPDDMEADMGDNNGTLISSSWELSDALSRLRNWYLHSVFKDADAGLLQLFRWSLSTSTDL